MKRVQLSGAQKRKQAKEKEHTISVVKATSRKLTNDDKDAGNRDENDKINQAIDPGLWIDFSAYDVAYWVDCGPTNCQHHFVPFDKSCRLLELVRQFDLFLASHIAKNGNSGKGNPSYLSKTICEELIEIMSKKVREVIADKVKASGYFSLSVDSTPDISHIDQLRVVLRYVADGKPIESFLTFLEFQNHTGEGMAKQVLQVSQALQKEHVNLKTCADLYSSLADHLHKSRNEFERFKEAAKIMTPGVEYKSTLTHNRKRKPVFNDGDAPEVSLNARDKFLISAFYAIVDKLETEMSRQRQVYNDVAVRFSCLVDGPLSQTSQCCEELINTYPKDLNNNLYTELQQFHSYIRHKFPAASKSENNTFNHGELYQAIVRDNIESAFPNVEIAFRIFLALMVTNCSTERSFSQLKRTKNPNRSTMKQERLDSFSLLMIEADMLHKIKFDDILKDFGRSRKKFGRSRKKFFKCK
ncbi:uncharacterized protein LOC136079198 [Hydra vulgaris]|uniref:Uncharacterized protein LOC136079198 n=1 Tax=Hydra vulgaris TaxID=6087 RepID=A0ABM4BPD5_HYDVU